MRRPVLVVVLLAGLAVFAARAEPTGSALPGLEPYDELMTGLIKKWDVAGAGLAVAYKDRLLLARGYGSPTRSARSRWSRPACFVSAFGRNP